MTPVDYNNLAPGYQSHRQVHPKVVAALAKVCKKISARRVLESGCGTGAYLGQVQALTGCVAVGIDPSEKMLEIARRDTSYKIKYIAGRAEALPVRAGYFDLAYSVDMIHHLDSPLDYFISAARALREGGVICTVTDSESMIRKRVLTRYFPETAKVDLARYPSVPTLRLNMKAAGFVKIRERTVKQKVAITDIEPYRARAYSCLRLIADRSFEKGLARMEQDLARRHIKAAISYLMLWGAKSSPTAPEKS